MKIWLYGWVFSLSLWCTGAMGQQKLNYKVAEQFLPSVAGKFIYSKDIKANYVPNSDCFWFSHKTSQGTAYYWVDPRKKEQRPLFDNARMAEQINALTHKICDAKNINITPNFGEDKRYFTFFVNNVQLRYDMKTGVCSEVLKAQPDTTRKQKTPLPSKPHNPLAMQYSISTDRAYTAFCRGHNLYIRKGDEADSLARPVTTDGETYYSYSFNEVVEGDRLIATRASWLKDSHRLFIIRKDNRGIGDLPVVASTGSGRPRLVHSIGGSGRYPMPGDKKVTQYELSLIDAETGTLTRVPIEKWKDQSLKLLKVSQDGHYLYLQRTRRTRD